MIGADAEQPARPALAMRTRDDRRARRRAVDRPRGARRGDGIVVVLMVRAASTARRCAGWIARWFARTAAPACRIIDRPFPPCCPLGLPVLPAPRPEVLRGVCPNVPPAHRPSAGDRRRGYQVAPPCAVSFCARLRGRRQRVEGQTATPWSTAAVSGVLQQAGDRHRAGAAGVRRQPAGDRGDGRRVDVADDAARSCATGRRRSPRRPA